MVFNIQEKVDSLPQAMGWDHGGVVRLPAGEIELHDTVVIRSPFVRIEGQGAGVTRVVYKGVGPAFHFELNPWRFVAGGLEGGGLHDMTIDGYAAGPRAMGLLTRDIIGFRASGVHILGFKEAGSVGWWSDIVHGWNERHEVQATIGDCETAVLFTNSAPPDDVKGWTLGYGFLRLYLNVWPGGVAIKGRGNGVEHPMQVWNESVHIVINGRKGTCIDLADHARLHVHGVIHCEQNPIGLKSDWTSGLVVDGYATGLYLQQFSAAHWLGCLKTRLQQVWHRVRMTGQETY